MFSDFAKLFSRDFILGFLLPSVLFVVAGTIVFLLFHPMSSEILNNPCKQIAGDWTIPIALFAIWLLGVLLLAANRSLVRFLEGYDVLQHTCLLDHQQRKFDKLCFMVADLKKKRQEEPQCEGSLSETRRKYKKKLLQRRTYYPPERENVLPTKFGNVMRAFETYSRSMYGIDAIPLWPRLSAMVPEAYGEMLNWARAQVNFAVNVFYLPVAIVVEYGILAALTRTLPALWLVGLAILIMWGAYRMAIINAVQWGNLVKGSFDLYRYDLLKQMGLERPASWEQERVLWTAISRSFLYWEPLEAARSNNAEAPLASGGSKVTSGGMTPPD